LAPPAPTHPSGAPSNRTGSLIIPPEFHHLQLGIDREHRVLVCQGCGVGVPRSALGEHIRKNHGGSSQLPKNYESILDLYEVPHEIPRPNGKVRPIHSILVLDGFMCSFPGCHYAGTLGESITRHHSKGHVFPIGSCRFSESKIQILYKGHKVRKVWAVQDDCSSFCGEGVDFGKFFEGVMSEEERRWRTTVMTPPTDPRHVNGFLSMFHWLDLTSGHSLETLSTITQPPSAKSTLFPVINRVKKYFDGIRPTVRHMSPLILKWVNSTTE
jgi:hypothetical protein